ncbi:MAG: adenylate/guanylate cyclase domain-containing protein [Candidatus Ozemobacteraceae bacterium]
MAKLTFFLSDGSRTEHVLEEGVTTIGRHTENTVRIPENPVSKKHCAVTKNGSDVTIEDLGSTNGTFIAGRRISGPEVLQEGDEISLGGVRGLLQGDKCLPGNGSSKFSPTMISVASSGADLASEQLNEARLQTPRRLTPVFSSHVSSEIQGRITVERAFFRPENEIPDADALRRDYEKLRIAYEIMQMVGQEIDLDRVLEKILGFCFDMLPADRGVVLLYDDSGIPVPRAVHSRNVEQNEELIISSSMVRKMETDKVGILCYDALRDPRFNSAQSVISQGIRSSMTVPLLHKDELLGIILLDSLVAANAFSEKDLQILSSIAGQAALLVANASLARLHEEEAVARARLQRLFSPAVAELVASGRLEVKQGGEPRRTTVLFADIRGFTAMSETMSAGEIVDLLNQYFECMVDVVFQFEGTVDKFVGDELMALFGAPASLPDDAVRAVKAALTMLDELEKFNIEREANKQPVFQIGIGINTGDVVAGYIGSSKALQYTVIGAPVNLASRLCSRARDGHCIVISEMTWKDVQGYFQVEEMEPMLLKGISQPVRAFSVIKFNEVLNG